LTTLVEQLQADAIDRSVPINDLLRKAKITAAKLGRADLREWIESELSGYARRSEIPKYRISYPELKFFNPYRGWCPIIGGITEYRCAQAISEIGSLLESNETTFTVSLTAKEVEFYCEQIGFPCDVKRHISRSSLAAIVDAVRNTVLDWALKLEEAGVHGDGLSFSKKETEKAQAVTINIGKIGNAVGIGNFGDQATITATQTLNATELAKSVKKLVEGTGRTLPNSGLSAPIQKEVSAALAALDNLASDPKPDAGRLQRALVTLKTVVEQAAGNVVGAGIISLIDRVLSAI
jgi:AbiTii